MQASLTALPTSLDRLKPCRHAKGACRLHASLLLGQRSGCAAGLEAPRPSRAERHGRMAPCHAGHRARQGHRHPLAFGESGSHQAMDDKAVGCFKQADRRAKQPRTLDRKCWDLNSPVKKHPPRAKVEMISGGHLGGRRRVPGLTLLLRALKLQCRPISRQHASDDDTILKFTLWRGRSTGPEGSKHCEQAAHVTKQVTVPCAIAPDA